MLTSTMAKTRRIQPQSTNSIVKLRPPSPSTSISSVGTHTVELDSHRTSAASSSAVQPEVNSHHRVELSERQPLVESELRNVRFTGSESLLDPEVMTNSEHLNPRRDGIFARMRNRALYYGTAIVAGTAVGAAAGFTAKQFLFQNNNNNNNDNNITITQPETQTNQKKQTDTDTDGIAIQF